MYSLDKFATLLAKTVKTLLSPIVSYTPRRNDLSTKLEVGILAEDLSLDPNICHKYCKSPETVLLSDETKLTYLMCLGYGKLVKSGVKTCISSTSR